ncbi:hypothetical protein CYMTET_54160 [Cymbomonas tetramitiformis]|uniref:Phytanoyl-CoA dioxygenase n=1 Tax=Cymbomonas tetramitiformis TaxID=36881 RepID=A0AAE0BFI5_9CHLO|nr:hypothetical protein CYMTET_54160 [Cymbomonas tetramitiformis]
MAPSSPGGSLEAALSRVDYWAGICPELTIRADRKLDEDAPPPISSRKIAELKKCMLKEGYFQVCSQDFDVRELASKLARGVKALRGHGWPPTFIAIYDEAWEMVRQLSPLMLAVTGNKCNMDLVAWYVDPSQAEAGFMPHRDRAFGSGSDIAAQETAQVPASFNANGLPKYCTCWIALSEAQPDNGCLYVVPAWADPGYREGDALSLSGPEAVPADKWGLRRGPTGAPIWSPNCNEGLQAVRAVPCHRGDAVFLSHRVLHWGSQGREGSPHGPRISFSFAASTSGFEEPYLPEAALPFPTIELRLTLAAAQMMSYGGRFPQEEAEKQRYLGLYKKGRHGLGPEFRSRIDACAKAIEASEAFSPRESGETSQDERRSKKKGGEKTKEESHSKHGLTETCIKKKRKKAR